MRTRVMIEDRNGKVKECHVGDVVILREGINYSELAHNVFNNDPDSDASGDYYEQDLKSKEGKAARIVSFTDNPDGQVLVELHFILTDTVPFSVLMAT